MGSFYLVPLKSFSLEDTNEYLQMVYYQTQLKLYLEYRKEQFSDQYFL